MDFAGKASVDVEGECSGDWTGGVIVDRVKIPVDLPAGDYVLGWVRAKEHSYECLPTFPTYGL